MVAFLGLAPLPAKIQDDLIPVVRTIYTYIYSEPVQRLMHFSYPYGPSSRSAHISSLSWATAS